MRLRTDGIRRTKFREIILTDRKHGYVRGIFWAHTPEDARHFGRLMRSLQFAVRIKRVKADGYHDVDQQITYIIGNWRHI
jgi:hypothetical protein